MAAIRAIGDNTGCMALKGASPDHEGEERADGWPLDEGLAAVGERWGIDPGRDLVAGPLTRLMSRVAACRGSTSAGGPEQIHHHLHHRRFHL